MNDRVLASDQEEVLRGLGQIAKSELGGEATPAQNAAERERFVFAMRERAAEKRAQRRNVAIWLLPAAAALAIGAGVWRMGWLAPRLTYTVDASPQPANGYVRVAEHAAPSTVHFSDGSEIRVDPGSEIRVEDLDQSGARVALFRGRTSVNVVHRDRTRWAVSAGPFVVRVTGTSFDLGWMGEEAKLEVTLRSGSVVVEGPLTRTGVPLAAGHRLEARLSEGRLLVESLDAARTAKANAAPSPEDVGTIPPAQAPSATAPIRSAGPAADLPSWPRRVVSGDYAGVIAEARARGLDSTFTAAPLSDLVALADAARYTGENEIARRALLTQRARFADSADARAAAFLLGRMIQDADGAPSLALEWFDRYLAESPRGPFSSEALGRKMMAVRKVSGDLAARAVARAYLERFPSGAYAAAAKEIASSQ